MVGARTRRSRAWLGALLLLACGTSEEPLPQDTGVLVVVRSDLEAGRELARLQLETRRQDGNVRTVNLLLGQKRADGVDAVLPASFAVYADASDIEHGVELRVSGYSPDGLDPRVRRVVRLGFRREKLLRLVIDLASACEGRFAECERIGQTCGGDGGCIPVAVDAASLSEVSPGEEHDALPLFSKPKPAEQARPGRELDVPRGDPDAPQPDPDTPRDDRDGGVPSVARDTSVDPPLHPMDAGRDGGTGVSDAGLVTGPTADRDAGQDADMPACAPWDRRCRGGALYRCRDGAWADPEPCSLGCHEGAGVCDTCGPGQMRCQSDELQVCRSGFFATVTTCPLGCSSLVPECLECVGPAGECDADGSVRLCGSEGRWWRAPCYAGCQSGAWADDEDAGVSLAGSWAACVACSLGERTCRGPDILSCDVDGLALPVGCHFGCADASACREDTAIGQALLHTLL